MFKLTIDTDNAAFEDDREIEIARILTHVAHRIKSGVRAEAVRDVNGNRVGSFDLTEEG